MVQQVEVKMVDWVKSNKLFMMLLSSILVLNIVDLVETKLVFSVPIVIGGTLFGVIPRYLLLFVAGLNVNPLLSFLLFSCHEANPLMAFMLINNLFEITKIVVGPVCALCFFYGYIHVKSKKFTLMVLWLTNILLAFVVTTNYFVLTI